MYRHTLRGCVDWNTELIAQGAANIMSHPAWVCGLKPSLSVGLPRMQGHTLRGCVDWNSL